MANYKEVESYLNGMNEVDFEVRKHLKAWSKLVDEICDHLHANVVKKKLTIKSSKSYDGAGDFHPGHAGTFRYANAYIEVNSKRSPKEQADVILFESCNAELESDYVGLAAWFQNELKISTSDLFAKYGIRKADIESNASWKYAKLTDRLRECVATVENQKIRAKLPENYAYLKTASMYGKYKTSESSYKLQMMLSPHDSGAKDHQKLPSATLYEIEKIMDLSPNQFVKLVCRSVVKDTPNGALAKDAKKQIFVDAKHKPRVILLYQKRAEKEFNVTFKFRIGDLFSSDARSVLLNSGAEFKTYENIFYKKKLWKQ